MPTLPYTFHLVSFKTSFENIEERVIQNEKTNEVLSIKKDLIWNTIDIKRLVKRKEKLKLKLIHWTHKKRKAESEQLTLRRSLSADFWEWSHKTSVFSAAFCPQAFFVVFCVTTTHFFVSMLRNVFRPFFEPI